MTRYDFFVVVALLLLVGRVSGQITVPAGFEVQTLFPASPDLGTVGLIRNPDYGSGFLNLRLEADFLIVERVNCEGDLDAVFQWPGFSAYTGAVFPEFDSTGLFDNELFVAARNSTGSILVRVDPSWEIETVATFSGDTVVATVAFSDGSSGYAPGLYAYDGDIGGGGQTLFHIDTSYVVTALTSTLPPGRTDIDSTMQFAPTVSFVGKLTFIDADRNSDGLSAIYYLTPGLVWETLVPAVPISQRRFGSGRFSGESSGFGDALYVPDHVTNAILKVDPKGNIEVFATEFNFGVCKIVFGADHESLYVQDEDGFHRIAPEGGPSGCADLVPRNLEIEGLSVVELSGTLATVRVSNLGSDAGAFSIALFEDVDEDSIFHVGVDTLLGMTVVQGLLADEESEVLINVVGEFSFAGASLSVYVDSENTVPESDEGNNYVRQSVDCAREVLPFELSLEEKWSVTNPTSHIWLYSTPAVGNLDEDPQPEVIYVVFEAASPTWTGKLRAVDGVTGEIEFEVDSPLVAGPASAAIADIDGDSLLEIVIPGAALDSLLCFENDGSLKWSVPTEVVSPNSENGGASIADLDGDGSPEITYGRQAFSNTGTLLWTGTGGYGGEPIMLLSVVSDIDADGHPELLTGNTVYHGQTTAGWTAGAIMASTPSVDGHVAVADFDSDGLGEIVVVSPNRIALLQHDMTIVWEKTGLEAHDGAGGGAVVADFDGDGLPEIGVAGATRYVALDSDGSLLWSNPTQDLSSNRTGSTVFDIEGDGNAEIFYQDEIALYVFNGSDGEIILEVPSQHGTGAEYPVIADVDLDGAADLLLSEDTIPGTSGYLYRLVAFSGPGWVATRSIANQHAYSITNINDDGSVPTYAEPNWLFPPDNPYNSFRQNILTEAPPLSLPDLTASRLSVTCTSDLRSVSARIGNAGAFTAFAPVPVSFYAGDPESGAELLGTVETTIPITAGSYEDVALELPLDYDCTQEIFVVADDAGGLQGIVAECNEDNNVASAIPNVETFTDYTLQLSAGFQQTTYSETTSIYLMQSRACNGGPGLVDYPIRLVIENFTEPNVIVHAPDGLTDGGKPYFEFEAPEGGADFLTAGECSDWKWISFYNPDEVPVLFEYSWIAPDNAAPLFTSLPGTLIEIGSSYSYTASAVDPNGHAIEFSKLVGPGDLTVDPDTGLTSWSTPELGTHAITIRVTDDRGAFTDQSFTLEVSPEVNRPPYFTSLPDTHASVGAVYQYLAMAQDPDGDPLTFTLEMPFPPVPDPLTPIEVSADGLVTWDFTLAGSYLIRVRVSDGQGAYADQGFVLTVGSVATNPHAPTLTGAPPLTAVVGLPYLYQPVGQDIDPGDTLTYAGTPGAVGVDPATGLLSWTPTALDLGAYPVSITVTDESGAFATQSWTINVVDSALNLPPVVTSVPVFSAIDGETYTYAVVADDPEDETLDYELVPGATTLPGGNIDPASGLINWDTPVVGMYTVAIRVSDPAGAFGSQVFTLSVIPPNDPPTISAIDDASVYMGQTLQVAVAASDPNGHSLTYALDTAPNGMTVHPTLGFLSWTPTEDQASDLVGDHDVTVEISDGFGGMAQTSFLVTVLDDSVDPEVQIAYQQVTDPSNPVRFVVTVFASDDVGVTERTLTVEGAPVPLDAQGQYLFYLPDYGVYDLEATASDAAGNVGLATTQIDFTADPNLPIVEIDFPPSPQPESTITCPVDLVGSVYDLDGSMPPQIVEVAYWEVRIVRESTGEVRVINAGLGNVTNGYLGTIDPTLLPNDSYRIEIEGYECTVPDPEKPLGVAGACQHGGVSFNLHIAGDFKVGNFALSFTDLVIPVAGIPLTVTRQYDSLDTSPGDFGPGWRLGLPGDVRDNVDEAPPGSGGFFGGLTDQPYDTNTRVYVTRPDGRRVGFTFAPTPGLLGIVWNPRFEPDPGVTDTLEAWSAATDVFMPSLFSTGSSFVEFVFPFNPRRFLFTTKQGVKYTLDEVAGLQLIEDRNGNTIDVTPGGLVWSPADPANTTTVELVFERDQATGRIERIIPPDLDPDDGIDPPALEYEYDAAGNLVEVRDLNENPTFFGYTASKSFPHHLTEIEVQYDTDGRGDPLVRSVLQSLYDDEGRLVAQCSEFVDPGSQDFLDATDGDPETSVERCFEFSPVEGGQQVVLDGRGYQTVLSFDERGNVVQELRYVDLVTSAGDPVVISREFDLENNLLLESIDGVVTYYTYDSRGNQLSTEDEEGRMWTWTYNGLDLRTTQCDPSGNCTTFSYDPAGNLTEVTNPLGNLTQISYAPGGLREHVVDSNGSVWEFSYDTHGNVAAISFPSQPAGSGISVVEHFEHDSLGRLRRRVDRMERVTEYQYDAAGRLVQELWSFVADPSSVRAIQYAYDDAGSLQAVDGPDTEWELAYTAIGELESFTTGAVGGTATPYTVSYGHDGNGNTTSVIDSLGGETGYEYDFQNLLVQVLQSGANVDEKRMDFTRDGNGLVTESLRYANILDASPAVTTDYEYDCGSCASRLSLIEHRASLTDTLIHRYQISRNEVGDPTQIIESTPKGDLQIDLSVDGLRRILAVDYTVLDGTPFSPPAENYSYDGVGNRLSSHESGTYVYAYQQPGGTGNQLRSDDSYEYEYDANGNLSRQLSIASGARSEFEYDHRNRLIQILHYPDEFAVVPDWASTYCYDAGNRRTRSQESGLTRQYLYDGNNAVVVLDDFGTQVKRRMYGRGIDTPLAFEQAQETQWYLSNQVRSVSDLVDDQGQVSDFGYLDSFGRELDQAPTDDDLGFQSRERTSFGDLYYFRARYYSPQLGRSITRDPIAPYRYAMFNGNPTVFIDPTGETALATYVSRLATALQVLSFLNTAYGCYVGENTALGFIELPPNALGCVTAFAIEFTFSKLIEALIPNPILPGPEWPPDIPRGF